LNGINFSDANLQHSYLVNVKMMNATLKNTDFRYSEISGDFRQCIFDGIRLDDIKMGFLDIEGIEIRDAKLMEFVDTNDVASFYNLPEAETIAFIPEANPFGDDNLDIMVDSVYLFRMIEEAVNTPLAIGWIELNPAKATLKEFNLDDTTYLEFNKSLLENFPLECSK